MSSRRTRILAASVAAVLALGVGAQMSPLAASSPIVRVPAPTLTAPPAAKSETAILAGGCFWGVQGVYQRVKGVRSAVSGYAGGSRADASYEQVGGGNTRHAEAVRIVYDPAQVSYGQILQIFFSVVADPTTLNAQGPDRGPQYRSAIFPTTPAQKKVAAAYIAQLEKARVFPRPIVTRIESAPGFFAAEAYHQDYLVRNPDAAYIRINDLPKVQALKTEFPRLWRDTPVLVRG